jgi:hypothetical protein
LLLAPTPAEDDQPLPATASSPLLKLSPALWTLIFTYLKKMPGNKGNPISTMFILGAISPKFDSQIPKISLGTFGNYPKRHEIIDHYQLKKMSLLAARSLLLREVHDFDDQAWYGNTYTTRQVTAYRTRYHTGARFHLPEQDIILKIGKLRELLEQPYLHAMSINEGHVHYRKVAFALMFVVSLLFMITAVTYDNKSIKDQEELMDYCGNEGESELPGCENVRANLDDDNRFKTIFTWVFGITAVLVLFTFPVSSKIMQWRMTKYAPWYTDLLTGIAEILGDCEEKSRLDACKRKTEILSFENLFFILDQIKILHPFLSEEEQATNIEKLDRLLERLGGHLDIESGQPAAREMLRM